MNPTPATPAEYVAEYFPENSADRLIAFREALAGNTPNPPSQGFVDDFGRRLAESDQSGRTVWITVDAATLLTYLDEELADGSEPDPEVEPELAAVAAVAPSVLRARVLDAVAVGVPITRIAEVAETSRPTIYKWIADAKS